MLSKINLKEVLILHNLILHKIKLQFSDQLFGYAWAVLNPLMYIFSFWFFAYIGLKGGTIQGFPFIVWVIPGLLAYRFLIGVFAKSATMLTANAMLIKETGVDVRVLPLVEALKECYIHFFVMIIMFGVYGLVGYSVNGTWETLPNIYYLNFIYYGAIAAIYVVLLSYIISAVGLIFRDTKNIIAAAMVPIFWMSPVLFTVENGVKPLLEKAEMILNPFYYFIHGYRNTMLYNTFFYEDGLYNLYMILTLLVMALIAKKLWNFILPIVSDLV